MAAVPKRLLLGCRKTGRPPTRVVYWARWAGSANDEEEEERRRLLLELLLCPCPCPCPCPWLLL